MINYENVIVFIFLIFLCFYIPWNILQIIEIAADDYLEKLKKEEVQGLIKLDKE